MKFIPTLLAGSYLVELEPFSDERGWFARYYCKDEFATIGHNQEWLQMNHSFTKEKGTLRGMHFNIRRIVRSKWFVVWRVPCWM